MTNANKTVKIEGTCTKCNKSTLKFMRMIEFEMNKNSGGICNKCYQGQINLTNFEIWQ
jgi:hypothetical protein